MHERQQRHRRRRRNEERRRRIKQKVECAYYLHAVHDIVIDDVLLLIQVMTNITCGYLKLIRGTLFRTTPPT
jgi:hypothetical protein